MDPARRLEKFRYHENRVIKPVKKVKHKKLYDDCPNLNPSLVPDLQIIFVGFNPGVESSKSQHHYAHHTNLFWKLFNQAGILIWTLNQLNITEYDDFLKSLMGDTITKVKPIHDFDLVNYKIGFTDLVLRCTTSAQELTVKEKLENVPRLLQEFKSTQCRKIVIIGKGIWEIIIKYIQASSTKKTVKFNWGKQDNEYIEWMINQLEYTPEVYVLPSTSGLVTTMNFNQKLQLWKSIIS